MENNKILGTEWLIDILGGNKKEETIDDISKFKYVLYVRKSTDETDKQIRSLQDQIDECMDFAKQKGINIVSIVQESESAKYSGIRGKFNQMLKDMENKKYDGILAWHPNRLARNMKDAGEIIDMLDKKIIKDLKFASFYFENSASGKLTLGITFALAKQYTDQLSDDVTRGNKRSTLDGKSISMAKHGYKKDSNGRLIPNQENFALIKEAFNMRINGETLENISEYLSRNGYCRYKIINKQTKEYGNVRYKFNKDTLTDVFKNPIYTGILQHGDIIVNLKNKYDFIPMISAEDFCKINNIKDGNVLLNKNQKTGMKANLLNGRIKCIKCNKTMTAGITNRKLQSGEINHIFYYRCASEGCQNHNKSIRAKEIRDSIIRCLSDYDINEEKALNIYSKEIEEISKNAHIIILNNKKSLNVKKRQLYEKLELTKNTLNSFDLSKDDHGLINMYKEDIIRITEEIKIIDEDLIELGIKKDKNKMTSLILKKLVEPIRILASTTLKVETLAKLDNILKNVCLNCYVDDKKVVKLELKEPLEGFMELKKDPKVLSGGRTKS